jgi:uncharacterized protein YjiS (DUF1127 family)
MSVHTADSQFTFQLPTLSYVDTRWEESDLSTLDVAQSTVRQGGVRQGGLAAWLSRQISAFVAANRNGKAVMELSAMSDRELWDIGLSRSDLGRVFDPAHNQDLMQRGAQIRR